MRGIPYSWKLPSPGYFTGYNLYSGDKVVMLLHEIIIVTMLGLNLTSKRRFSLNPVCTGSRRIVHKLIYVR